MSSHDTAASDVDQEERPADVVTGGDTNRPNSFWAGSKRAWPRVGYAPTST